jgi:hypothetical protein
MVSHTGKTLCTDTFKPVNMPEILNVEVNSSGLPAAVKNPRRQIVKSIEDQWRIDDEWWRSEPVSRLYYAVMLTSGHHLTLYHDLITGNWYKQKY